MDTSYEGNTPQIAAERRPSRSAGKGPAITSMVSGLISLLYLMVILFGAAVYYYAGQTLADKTFTMDISGTGMVVSWTLGLAGLVFGIISLAGKRPGKNMAITGIALFGANMLATIAFYMLIGSIILRSLLVYPLH